jgi:hypothetical protein
MKMLPELLAQLIHDPNIDPQISSWFTMFKLRSNHIECFKDDCKFGSMRYFWKEDVERLFKESDREIEIPLKCVRCKKCKFAKYCSRKCLVSDWKYHRNTCMEIESQMEIVREKEVKLQNYIAKDRKKYNLFTERVGILRRFPDGREYCEARAIVTEKLVKMAGMKGYSYLYDEALSNCQELLRLDQQDLYKLSYIFPALLIEKFEFRKAYTFCLDWACGQGTNDIIDWPIDLIAQPDSWIWGKICCDVRVLQNPFRLPEMDHDDYNLIEKENYPISHLLAMAVIKASLYQYYMESKGDLDNKELEEKFKKQIGYVKPIFKEITSRNKHILKAILYPQRLYEVIEDEDEYEEEYECDHDNPNWRPKEMELAVLLYAPLFRKRGLIPILLQFLNCGKVMPSYSVHLVDDIEQEMKKDCIDEVSDRAINDVIEQENRFK